MPSQNESLRVSSLLDRRGFLTTTGALRCLTVGMCLALVVRVPYAQAQSQSQSLTLARGTAWFDAQATFGDFTGTTSALRGAVRSPAGPQRAAGWMVIPLDSLQTGNGSRDGHMRGALETDRFPEARFELDSLRPAPSREDSTGASESAGGPQSVRLFGRFTVHGEAVAMVATGVLTQPADGAWHLQASFPVTLAEHGISKGLTRMLGTIRVRPVVQVRVDLSFSAPASGTR